MDPIITQESSLVHFGILNHPQVCRAALAFDRSMTSVPQDTAACEQVATVLNSDELPCLCICSTHTKGR